jgi:ubiquitin-protein ligase
MKRLRKELKKLREPVKPADVVKAAAVEKFAEVSVGDDMTKWTVLLKGPDGVDPELPFAPFAGATFTVEIQFPSEYPFKAPKVRFDTPIFHPNGESALRSLSACRRASTRHARLISGAHLRSSLTQRLPSRTHAAVTAPVGEPDSDMAGEICAEILEKGWSPTLDASHIITTLHGMLLTPNPGECALRRFVAHSAPPALRRAALRLTPPPPSLRAHPTSPHADPSSSSVP